MFYLPHDSDCITYLQIFICLVLVSRRRSYCTGHSSGMGLSVFSIRDGPERERVGDGSVGATDISKFRCPGLSGYERNMPERQ